MRKLLFAAVGAAALATASAAGAVTVITPGAPGGGNAPGTSFQVSGNPFTGTDVVTAIIGHTGLPTGAFTDDYQFTIGTLGQGLIGTGSGGLTTSITFGQLGGPADVDILSVLVNGMAAVPHFFDLALNPCPTPGVGSCGAFENFTIDGVPITGGVLNHIVVNGTVGGPNGQGSYSGTATFQPGGVPEPATWAMMLLGFAAVGWQLRRRARPALMQIA